MEKYWSVVNIVQQDLETRKGDKERQIIMIGVRKALSGNGTLSLPPLGIYVGLEKAVHGEVTLMQMNGRERERVEVRENRSIMCPKI